MSSARSGIQGHSPEGDHLPQQIPLLRSWSFFCAEIYKDLAPPEPFFNALLGAAIRTSRHLLYSPFSIKRLPSGVGKRREPLQDIQDRKQEDPHNVDKMPIQTCALEEPVLLRSNLTGKRSDQRDNQ